MIQLWLIVTGPSKCASSVSEDLVGSISETMCLETRELLFHLEGIGVRRSDTMKAQVMLAYWALITHVRVNHSLFVKEVVLTASPPMEEFALAKCFLLTVQEIPYSMNIVGLYDHHTVHLYYSRNQKALHLQVGHCQSEISHLDLDMIPAADQILVHILIQLQINEIMRCHSDVRNLPHTRVLQLSQTLHCHIVVGTDGSSEHESMTF